MLTALQGNAIVRNRASIVVVLTATLLAALALAGAPASAELSRPYLRGFAFTPGVPSVGPAFGQGMAIDSDDNVYIVTQNEKAPATVIRKFDSEGNPVPFSASTSYIAGNQIIGTPSGPFVTGGFVGGPREIFVDRSGGLTDGYLYIVVNGGLLAVFDSTGTYKGNLVSKIPGQEACGVAVNPTTGEVYVSGRNAWEVNRLTPTGGDPAGYTVNGVLKTNGVPYPCGMVVDSTGALYIGSDGFSSGMRKYPPTAFETANPGVEVAGADVFGYTIDPTSNALYLDYGDHLQQQNSSNELVGGSFGNPAVTDPSNYLSTGIAVDSAGFVYATNAGGEVSVFGPGPPINVPKATSAEATEVTKNSATLNGSVDPDGAGNITGCVFKYHAYDNTKGSVPCLPAATPGTPFTTPTAVSANVAALSSGTTYHYRVFATNANGTQAGGDKLVTTEVAVAGVTTEAATAVKKDGAVLHGSFMGDGKDVHYYFEWGTTTAYGKTTPAPPGADAGTAGGLQSVTPVSISGLQGDTVYHYRLVATNEFGKAFGPDEALTTDHPVTNLTADQPTNVTDVSAELNASFDADSYDTHYYFEWGVSTNYGTKVPAPPGNDAGTGSGNVKVAPVQISGLQEGARYHFRVIASNSNGTTISADREFKTASKPGVNSFGTKEVTDTTAHLLANISSNQAETTYHFEYGPTTQYGRTVPISDGTIPADLEEHAIDVPVGNLESGLTYHFRVVATNKYGSVTTGDQAFGFYPPGCPNAQVRQETRSNDLPDCRAYEIASASQASGATVVSATPVNTGLATNPPRIAYTAAFGRIPDSGNPPNNMGDLYVATRTTTGWVTKYVGPPANEFLGSGGPPEMGFPGTGFGGPDTVQIGVQSDPGLNRITSYKHLWYPGLNGPFIYDTQTGQRVDRWPTNVIAEEGEIERGEEFKGRPYASKDFTHFVFSSNLPFTPEGEQMKPIGVGCYLPPFNCYAPGSSRNGGGAGEGVGPEPIYDNDVKSGTVSLVSLREDDTPFIGDPIRISDDGTHIVMSEGHYEIHFPDAYFPREPTRFFIRIDDEKTWELAPGHEVDYVGASASGEIQYIRSPEQLTPDDHDQSEDLFMWRESSPEELTRVSVGNNGVGGDSDKCSVSWIKNCGITQIDMRGYWQSQGGKGGNQESDYYVAANTGEIYFMSPEQLDGAKGEIGAENLYLYRPGGDLQFVTSLSHTTTCAPGVPPACSVGPIVRIQITPDGDHMAFVTPSRVTAFDNKGFTQMYTYEPSTERLICVSCRTDGEAPLGDTWGSQNGLFMAYDGRSFFSTVTPLVPQDTNKREDTYEFTEGRPYLLSSGLEPGPKSAFGFVGQVTYPGLVGVSFDGTDAYIAVLETLVTQDHNGERVKIYDARTNGGFPAEAFEPPCEAADECHGPSSQPPVPIVNGAGANVGKSGNLTHKKASKKKKAARKKKVAKRKAAKKKKAAKHRKGARRHG